MIELLEEYDEADVQAAVKSFVYGGIGDTYYCSDGLSFEKIVEFLRQFPEEDRKQIAWNVLDPELRHCGITDDCQMWDAIEAANQKNHPDRPAGCARTKNWNSGSNGSSNGKSNGSCVMPGFKQWRCWWPYAVGGLAVGWLLSSRHEEKKQRRNGMVVR